MANMTLSEYILEVVLPAFGATFRMLFASTILSIIFGFLLAIALVVTNQQGLHPNKTIYKILDFITNAIRSFPFIILIVALVPFTRLIVGTSIGEKAAIVPLTIAMTPFIGRLIENSLQEVDRQLIEAARSFGASDWQIIWHVMVVEAVPGIVSGIVFTVISALGATAMAGAVGAGGLGAIAIRYGYNNFNDAIMYSTVVLLLVLVQIIQLIGNRIYRKVL